VQFDPPNDHKDYLHRSGRTARAGAAGLVVALVEPGQVRELQRMHDAAGITAASDQVASGHQVVRQIAASGTPVPPAPPAIPPARFAPRGAPGQARRSGRGRRPARPAGSARDSAAQPGRRPENTQRAPYKKSA
jgi:superfamily II DNA/RNA helicase